MNCKHCGAEMEEGTKKCTECGKKNKVKMPKKKKIILISVIAFVFIACAVGGYFIYEMLTKNNMVDEFAADLDAANYEEAYSLYTGHRSFLFFPDEKVVGEMNDSIFSVMDAKRQQFLNEQESDLLEYIQSVNEKYADYIDTAFVGEFHDILYDEYINNDRFEDELMQYMSMYYNSETEEIRKLQRTAKDREAYKEAEELFANEEYQEAAKRYKDMKGSDELYYEDGRAKIDECYDLIAQEKIGVMKEFVGNGEYEKALDEEKEYRIYLKDNEPAQEYIEQIKQEFKDKVFALADEKIASMDYEEAIVLVENLRKYVLDDDVREKTNEIDDQYFNYGIERIKFLKTKVRTLRDTELGFTIVYPRSYKYINNLSEDTTVSISVAMHDEGYVYLIAIFGFYANEKIYFESIKFYYDDESEEWSIDTSDRQIDNYGNGSMYAESYIQLYDPDETNGGTTLTANLLNILKKLSDADESKIKFIGKDDVARKLTDDERESLQYIIELFELLDRYPELWDYMK